MSPLGDVLVKIAYILLVLPGSTLYHQHLLHAQGNSRRLAILTTGNMFSGSFAGLIAAGMFSGLDKVRGLAGWQWYVRMKASRLVLTNDWITGSSSFKVPYRLSSLC